MQVVMRANRISLPGLGWMRAWTGYAQSRRSLHGSRASSRRAVLSTLKYSRSGGQILKRQRSRLKAADLCDRCWIEQLSDYTWVLGRRAMLDGW